MTWKEYCLSRLLLAEEQVGAARREMARLEDAKAKRNEAAVRRDLEG